MFYFSDFNNVYLQSVQLKQRVVLKECWDFFRARAEVLLSSYNVQPCKEIELCHSNRAKETSYSLLMEPILPLSGSCGRFSPQCWLLCSNTNALSLLLCTGIVAVLQCPHPAVHSWGWSRDCCDPWCGCTSAASQRGFMNPGQSCCKNGLKTCTRGKKLALF